MTSILDVAPLHCNVRVEAVRNSLKNPIIILTAINLLIAYNLIIRLTIKNQEKCLQ